MKIKELILEQGGFSQAFKQGFNNPIDTIKDIATTTSPNFLSKGTEQSAIRLKDTQNIVPLKILDKLNQLDQEQRNKLYYSLEKNQIDKKNLLGAAIIQAGDNVKNRVIELLKLR
jgi:hypothetical protein